MKSHWKALPKYEWLGNRNRRIIQRYAIMAQSLSASCKSPEVAKRLEHVRIKLELSATTAERKADILAISIFVFYDFIHFRDVISGTEYSFETEPALTELESDVATLCSFVDNNISVSSLDVLANKRVIEFLTKKESVKAIYRGAQRSLESAKAKYERLCANETNLVNDIDKRRLVAQKKQLSNSINVWSDSVMTLSTIISSLDGLEETARLSPALAKKLNRLIKLKPLADFFYQPVKSDNERAKLKAELYYIIKNQVDAAQSEAVWSNTLYASDQTLDLTRSASKVHKTSNIENSSQNQGNTKIQKPNNLNGGTKNEHSRKETT